MSTSQQVHIMAGLRGSRSNIGATGRLLEITFDYMPDSFKMGLTSQFEKIPIPLTSAQMLLYQYTEVQDIQLSITAVTGMMARTIIRTKKGLPTKEVIGPQGDMALLARMLYAIAAPEDNDLANGLPPPMTVIQVGSLFGGVGAVSAVDIEHRGPWDREGNATDMVINVTFSPSNLYEPGSNRVGLAFFGGETGKDLRMPSINLEKSATSSPDLKRYLENAPTSKNILDPRNRPYVIQVGHNDLRAEAEISLSAPVSSVVEKFELPNNPDTVIIAPDGKPYYPNRPIPHL